MAIRFFIYFNRGIDDIGSWITTLKTHKIFKQGGAYYSYTDSKNKDYKFMAKDFPEMLKDEDLRKNIVEKAWLDIVKNGNYYYEDFIKIYFNDLD